MSNLSHLPPEERPRERLLQAGVEALSLAELIAIVLGSGTKGKNVLDLADELLVRFRGLSGLLEASIKELSEIKGIGLAKAVLLQAVFGIALRSRKTSPTSKLAIRDAKIAYELVYGELAHHKQEVLLVIMRDIKSRLIHYEKVSVGTLSQLLVHPREVFYPAIRYKAHSIIIAHNHPSGDPTPSKADLELTRHLLLSGKTLGIGLADHLIIGSSNYVSLRDEGYLGKESDY